MGGDDGITPRACRRSDRASLRRRILAARADGAAAAAFVMSVAAACLDRPDDDCTGADRACADRACGDGETVPASGRAAAPDAYASLLAATIALHRALIAQHNATVNTAGQRLRGSRAPLTSDVQRAGDAVRAARGQSTTIESEFRGLAAVAVAQQREIDANLFVRERIEAQLPAVIERQREAPQPHHDAQLAHLAQHYRAAGGDIIVFRTHYDERYAAGVAESRRRHLATGAAAVVTDESAIASIRRVYAAVQAADDAVSRSMQPSVPPATAEWAAYHAASARFRAALIAHMRAASANDVRAFNAASAEVVAAVESAAQHGVDRAPIMEAHLHEMIAHCRSGFHGDETVLDQLIDQMTDSIRELRHAQTMVYARGNAALGAALAMQSSESDDSANAQQTASADSAAGGALSSGAAANVQLSSSSGADATAQMSSSSGADAQLSSSSGADAQLSLSSGADAQLSLLSGADAQLSSSSGADAQMSSGAAAGAQASSSSASSSSSSIRAAPLLDTVMDTAVDVTSPSAARIAEAAATLARVVELEAATAAAAADAAASSAALGASAASAAATGQGALSLTSSESSSSTAGHGSHVRFTLPNEAAVQGSAVAASQQYARHTKPNAGSRRTAAAVAADAAAADTSSTSAAVIERRGFARSLATRFARHSDRVEEARASAAALHRMNTNAAGRASNNDDMAVSILVEQHSTARVRFMAASSVTAHQKRGEISARNYAAMQDRATALRVAAEMREDDAAEAAERRDAAAADDDQRGDANSAADAADAEMGAAGDDDASAVTTVASVSATSGRSAAAVFERIVIDDSDDDDTESAARGRRERHRRMKHDRDASRTRATMTSTSASAAVESHAAATAAASSSRGSSAARRASGSALSAAAAAALDAFERSNDGVEADVFLQLGLGVNRLVTYRTDEYQPMLPTDWVSGRGGVDEAHLRHLESRAFPNDAAARTDLIMREQNTIDEIATLQTALSDLRAQRNIVETQMAADVAERRLVMTAARQVGLASHQPERKSRRQPAFGSREPSRCTARLVVIDPPIGDDVTPSMAARLRGGEDARCPQRAFYGEYCSAHHRAAEAFELRPRESGAVGPDGAAGSGLVTGPGGAFEFGALVGIVTGDVVGPGDAASPLTARDVSGWGIDMARESTGMLRFMGAADACHPANVRLQWLYRRSPDERGWYPVCQVIAMRQIKEGTFIFVEWDARAGASGASGASHVSRRRARTSTGGRSRGARGAHAAAGGAAASADGSAADQAESVRSAGSGVVDRAASAPPDRPIFDCIRSATIPIASHPCDVSPPLDAHGARVMPTQRCVHTPPSGARCVRRTNYGQYCPQHLASELGLAVLPSTIPGAGLGVFTTRFRRFGDRVAPYTGELRPALRVKGRRAPATPGVYVLELHDGSSIDAARTDTSVMRFANSTTLATANCCFTQHPLGGGARGVGASVDVRGSSINAGTELTVWYGSSFKVVRSGELPLGQPFLDVRVRIIAGNQNYKPRPGPHQCVAQLCAATPFDTADELVAHSLMHHRVANGVDSHMARVRRMQLHGDPALLRPDAQVDEQ